MTLLNSRNSIVFIFRLWKTVFVEILLLRFNDSEIQRNIFKNVVVTEAYTWLVYHYNYCVSVIFFKWMLCSFCKPGLNVYFIRQEITQTVYTFKIFTWWLLNIFDILHYIQAGNMLEVLNRYIYLCSVRSVITNGFS